MLNCINHFDVIIVGAGPAGASCALALKNANLTILLIDKDSFPRDKICGDAIGGRSVKLLEKLSPGFVAELREFEKKEFISTTRFVIDETPFNLFWQNESYCVKRKDFDNLLLTHTLNNVKNLTFKPNFKIDEIVKENNKIVVGNKNTNTYYSSSILVAADGSQSFLAKQLIDFKLDPANFSAAVRAYYTNVSEVLPNQTEVHFNKDFWPGYFWIFPVNTNTVNVGFGCLSSEVSKRKINLKASLNQIIQASPELSRRFANAEMDGDIKGFGLAMGSKKVQLYGDNFLLIGDAASLIDPKSGDGISNAIESGSVAADIITDAYKNNNFSKEFLKKYKLELNKKIGKELFISTMILRAGMYFPFFLPTLSYLMRVKWLRQLARKF